MAYLLAGVLVDVSGSMETSIGERPNQEGGSWVRSIFNAVDGLIKHDVSSSNHVFALGFGASREPVAFDLLNTIHKNTKSFPEYENKENTEILEEILTILESSGAPRVRKWGKMNVLLDVVKKSIACAILEELKNNLDFKRRFVYECLPETCRTLEHSAYSYGREACFLAAGLADWGLNRVGVQSHAQEFATIDSVRDVIAKGKKLLSEYLVLQSISEAAILDVHKASEILHGGIGENELTNKRVDELMELVEPLIYGGTPLMTTIAKAKVLFAKPKFQEYTKLLFILSDGQPSDGLNPPVQELSDLGVYTVCCYITYNAIDDPKHLYSTEGTSWDNAAKLMFKMSSTITTQKIPRTIFVKREWNIDITNNETHLFVQVNHPDIIEDVCDLARDVVCCQEALSDVLSSVDLDLYINKANQGFDPKKQEGGTCYANASATVLHLSMKRIIGRDGGYPDFFQLRKEIIKTYGKHGADTLKVLQEICPKYRLHCKEVDVLGAMKAITAKRPVIARFRLTDPEWNILKKFYRENPGGILTSSTLDIKTRRSARGKLIGHAVVLTSFNSESLQLMNSWSSNWADGGFFKVSNADVLGLEFVDVYWTLDDLKQSEIDEYNLHGSKTAQQLISRLQGLQMAQYECPLCYENSRVVEFTGHHLQAKCPKCGGKFNTRGAGDDLAMNLYLLSLSTSARVKTQNKVSPGSSCFSPFPPRSREIR